MDTSTSQSGFVSNRSESQLQSQAQTPPEAELEQQAALILAIELSRGERRKRGMGVRGSFPMEKHNRGIYDPGWNTSYSTI